MDLRAFLAWSRRSGELIEIDRAVDPHLDLARTIDALQSQPALFSTLIGYPGWQAVSGVCARREHFAAALGCAVPDLVHRLADALAHPAKPQPVSNAACQEVVEPSVDLRQMPIPRYYALDGGRYISSGIVVVDDPDYGCNVAFHRLMLLDERRLAVRLVEGRGTHTAFSKSSSDLPVAIAIGSPIQVLLAAAMSPAKGVDEFGIAHTLAPTTLARCSVVDLAVPAEAEVVLEGHLTHELVQEGPFPDLTGTLDSIRLQPVIEIERITHRRAPLLHALLPGGLEHRTLMGMPREPTIFAAVNEVCRCTGVHVTPGGASWLHAVVQIEKRTERDGAEAIHAAFRGHTSLKHVVVVDTDVDLYDSADVEWAIATRFQADRDLVVLTDQPSSSLDPSARHVPGQKVRTTKMGLDATMPLEGDRAGFVRVRYDDAGA